MDFSDNLTDFLLDGEDFVNIALSWLKLSDIGWFCCIFITLTIDNSELIDVLRTNDYNRPVRLTVQFCRGISTVVNVLGFLLIMTRNSKLIAEYYPKFFTFWGYVNVNMASMNFGFMMNYYRSSSKVVLTTVNLLLHLVIFWNTIQVMKVYGIAA